MKEVMYLEKEDSQGWKGPGWYFADEVWSSVIGPYETEEKAEEAFFLYQNSATA